MAGGIVGLSHGDYQSGFHGWPCCRGISLTNLCLKHECCVLNMLNSQSVDGFLLNLYIYIYIALAWYLSLLHVQTRITLNVVFFNGEFWHCNCSCVRSKCGETHFPIPGPRPLQDRSSFHPLTSAHMALSINDVPP